MDPEQVKNVAWWLCRGAGGAALLTVLVLTVVRRERARAALSAAAAALLGALLAVAVAAVIGLKLPPGEGQRGAALAFGLAVVLAPLTAFCAGLLTEATGSLGTEIFMLGATLAELGWIGHTYGLNGQNIWQAWCSGAALGLCWTALTLRRADRERVRRGVVSCGVIALSLAWTVQLAADHYRVPAAWGVFFCGVGLLAGWILSLAIAGSLGERPALAAVLAALAMALAAGVVSVAVQTRIVHDTNLVPTLAAGFVVALLLMGLSGRRPVTGDADATRSAAIVLGLVGLAWVGFKINLGLGTALCGLGLLGALPCARLFAPDGVAAALVTRCAGCLALLSAFKVYQESADLRQNGMDVSDGNVMLTLVAGIGVPLLLEALYRARAESSIGALLRLVGSLLLCAGTVAVAALFGQSEGVGALLLGLAMYALLAAAVESARDGNGALTLFALPALLLIASVCIELSPWRDLLDTVTRSQKIKIVGALSGVAVLWIILAAMRSRSSASEGGGTEVDEIST